MTAGLDTAVGDVDVAVERSPAGWAQRFLLLGLMAAIVLITYAAILWSLRRGFGWGDEGFIDTMTASNRRAVGEPWGFQHLLHPLYVLTGESVLGFRILRLFGYVLLSVALVWCARLFLRRVGINVSRSGWAFILLLAQVGTFVAWAQPVRTIGYNELASWFSQLGVGLILLSLTGGRPRPQAPGQPPFPRDQRASRVLWSIWAGLGALMTLLVFAKVTAAVAFGAVLALALVVPNPDLRLWRRVVSLGTGAAAVLLVLWVCRVPIGFYVENGLSLVFDKSVRDAFGHPTAGMLDVYRQSLRSTALALRPAALLFTLALVALLWRAKWAGDSAERVGGGARGWVVDGATWVLGIFALIALIALPRADQWSYLGLLVMFIGAGSVMGLLLLGVDTATMRRSAPSRPFPLAVGAAVIAATPFISSVGTSNRLAGQFVFAATLWTVVFGIAVVLLTQRATLAQSRARALPALVGCVVISLAALAVRSDILNPYQQAPLLSQETSTSAPEFRGLLLDEHHAKWVDWLAAAGDSLDAQDIPAIAIDSSGALLAFNQSGYANPWIGKHWPVAYRALSRACTEEPPVDFFVLQPGNQPLGAPPTSRVKKSLAACGINFPGDFRAVGTRVDPQPIFAMTIWRLKPGWLAAQQNGRG